MIEDYVMAPPSRLLNVFVYAIQGGDKVKIGYAGNLRSRLGALQVACPVSLRVLDAIEVQSRERAAKLEKRIHSELSRLHSHGEWFGPVDQVMAIFRMVKEIGHERIIDVDLTA